MNKHGTHMVISLSDDRFFSIIDENVFPEILMTFITDAGQCTCLNCLPKNKSIFVIDENINQKIDLKNLSNTIITIIIGSYTERIDLTSLPDTITTIIFGDSFNQIIDLKSLPDTITTII